MSSSYVIRQGQTIMDLALQLYGDRSKALQLCIDNPIVLPNLLARNYVGKKILYTDPKNEITEYYKTYGVVIATQFPESETGGAYFPPAFPPPFTPPPTT